MANPVPCAVLWQSLESEALSIQVVLLCAVTSELCNIPPMDFLVVSCIITCKPVFSPHCLQHDVRERVLLVLAATNHIPPTQHGKAVNQ